MLKVVDLGGMGRNAPFPLFFLSEVAFNKESHQVTLSFVCDKWVENITL